MAKKTLVYVLLGPLLTVFFCNVFHRRFVYLIHSNLVIFIPIDQNAIIMTFVLKIIVFTASTQRHRRNIKQYFFENGLKMKMVTYLSSYLYFAYTRPIEKLNRKSLFSVSEASKVTTYRNYLKKNS